MRLKPISSHDTGVVLLTLVYGETHKISYISSLLIIFFFFDSPEEVASGVMQLIEDENYNAAVMTVTKTKGIEILEKWTPRLRKSNL